MNNTAQISFYFHHSCRWQPAPLTGSYTQMTTQMLFRFSVSCFPLFGQRIITGSVQRRLRTTLSVLVLFSHRRNALVARWIFALNADAPKEARIILHHFLRIETLDENTMRRHHCPTVNVFISISNSNLKPKPSLLNERVVTQASINQK